jgi:hypothetical protein
MTYTLDSISALRKQIATQLLEEERDRRSDKSYNPAMIDHRVIEARLQTLIMAGIGQVGDEEKRTSPEIAKLAAAYVSMADDEMRKAVTGKGANEFFAGVRSLAASALSQA